MLYRLDQLVAQYSAEFYRTAVRTPDGDFAKPAERMLTFRQFVGMGEVDRVHLQLEKFFSESALERGGGEPRMRALGSRLKDEVKGLAREAFEEVRGVAQAARVVGIGSLSRDVAQKAGLEGGSTSSSSTGVGNGAGGGAGTGMGTGLDSTSGNGRNKLEGESDAFLSCCRTLLASTDYFPLSDEVKQRHHPDDAHFLQLKFPTSQDEFLSSSEVDEEGKGMISDEETKGLPRQKQNHLLLAAVLLRPQLSSLERTKNVVDSEESESISEDSTETLLVDALLAKVATML